MDPRYQQIQTSFEERGWELASASAEDLDWWADEIWEFRSRWSPEGVPVFVTFLVDPQWEGDRVRRQGVWAVGSSASLPTNPAQAQENAVLRLKALGQEVGAFLDRVELLRSGAIDGRT